MIRNVWIQLSNGVLTKMSEPPGNPVSADGIPAPEGATQIISTGYEIGQDNINYRRRFVFELDIHNVVFSVSAIGVVAFTLLTLMFQNTLAPLFEGLRDFMTSRLDWFFMITANIFVLLCLALVILPLGRIFAWVRVSGLEHLEGISGPVVFASNHQSHFDVPVILM